MKNTITWFEINVANLERSIKFYNHVLEIEIRVMELDDFPAMGIFPDEGVNGALVEEKDTKHRSTAVLCSILMGMYWHFLTPSIKISFRPAKQLAGKQAQ